VTVRVGLDQVRERIAAACAASGREAGSVRLVAVSKTQPARLIEEAIAAGQRDFGENYLQDALPKMDALDQREDLAWHFIGRLQSNKTRAVAERFQWVHTVDRLKLIDRLDAQRPHHAPPLKVCIQVRGEGDARGSGAAIGDVPALVTAVAASAHLSLRGLMIVPPTDAVGDAARPHFRMLAELLRDLRAAGHDIDTLSMGMSGDLEAAVDEGATLVRVGTAIFGARTTVGDPG